MTEYNFPPLRSFLPSNAYDNTYTASTSPLLNDHCSLPLVPDPNNFHRHSQESRDSHSNWSQGVLLSKQMQALQETIVSLRAENAVLLASRDSYQDAYDKLVASLRLIQVGTPSEPGTTTEHPVILQPMTLTLPPQLNKSDYPNVRFWTHKSFKVYDKSANAQSTDRGAFPFLEDKDGHPLSEDHVAAIGQAMRAIWHGFKSRHIAPVTWGGASSAVKNEFIAEMVKAHPEVGFCEHYWKINALATARYSSWKQSYLTDSEGIQSEAKLDNLSRKKRKSLKVKISDDDCERAMKRLRVGDSDDSDGSIILSPTISGNLIDYETSTSSPHDTTASTPSEYPASTSTSDTDPSTTTNTSSSNTSISMNVSTTT
ncbi:hypothetical protein DEU56DRAFT_918067 [Suillus clintonianus]|uniref:uncharacterized protein n=1 Tax=Suillus clintonianus TaxID=1904413 RepID=UPI001B85F7C8|nr:uncharacterized protein DEU56DRAFT_918067 [Suillus clintonianus]KAG2121726.1 hypothetical protein DEU56DRAFT_918067 [Suillus clintonianus]